MPTLTFLPKLCICGVAILLGLLLLSARPGLADNDTQLPLTANEAAPAPGRLQVWGDRFHLQTTQALVNLSENLDNFFPNPDNLRFDYRRTHIQLQLGLQADTHGDLVGLQRLYGQIVLPRAEERFSLYFSGEQDGEVADPEALPEKRFLVPRGEATSLRFGFNTGLRFVLAESALYLTQYQIGVRLLPDWNPYNELSGIMRLPLGGFLFLPGQSFFWRQQDGFGETTRFNLDYGLGHGMLLRLHSSGTYGEEAHGFEHRHAISFLHQLRPTCGYTYTIEAQGDTEPKEQINKYLTGLTWKELVYADWLYIETGANLLFPHRDDFKPLPAVFFSLIGEFNGSSTATLPPREGKNESTPPPQTNSSL